MACRATQAYRTRVTNSFRECKQGVLVASDVAARGVDFPGVPRYTRDMREIHARYTRDTRARRRLPRRLVGDPDRRATFLIWQLIRSPGVSLVIQIGAPDTREQYVHRTGRTGRADKSGRALLLLAEWEERASMSMLEGLPIKRSHPSDADVDAARGEA